MTNIRLRSIDDYVDVSSKTNYHTYHLKDTIEERLRRIHLSSRDSARTPMQWDDSRYAGFSEAKPWFFVNPNYRRVNVAAQEGDRDSILNFYRKCLALRKRSKTLIYGEYKEYFPKDPNIYMYERVLGEVRYLVICSFTMLPVRVRIPQAYAGRKGQLMLCNYPPEEQSEPHSLKECASREINRLTEGHGMFRPYEARVYRFRTDMRD